MMKKTYLAPEAESIRFLTQDTMGPSALTTPGENSAPAVSGKEDVTEILPFNLF